MIGASIASAIASTVGRGAGMFQSYKTMEEGNLASINQGVQGRFLGEMLSGSLKSQLFMKNRRGIRGESIQEKMLGSGQWGGTEEANTKLWMQGVGGAAGIVQGAATLALTRGAGAGGAGGTMTTPGDIAGAGGHIAGGGLSILDAAMKGQKGYADAAEMATVMGGLDATIAANPYLSNASDLLQSEKHMRAAGGRVLESQHLGVRGVGAGYGYSFGESIQIAESMKRRAGMTDMFGSSTLTSRASLTPNEAHTAYEMRASGKLFGTPLGDMPLDAASAWLQDKSTDKFSRGRGRLQGAMQLAGAGMDMGVGQNALDSIFMATGGKAGGAEKTMQALERAVERGTERGFTSPRTQEELVAAMGQAAEGRILGGTEGLEFLAQTLGGHSSGDVTVSGASARRRVLGQMDGDYGNNSFFQGIAMAQAKNMLGGGNPAAAMAMGGASVTDLLVGSQQLSDFGIGRDTQKKAAMERMKVAFMARMSYDPEAAAAFKTAGGDLTKIDEKILRRTYGNKIGTNDEDAQAYADIVKGMGDGTLTDAKARRMKQHGDSAAMNSIRVEEMTKAQLVTAFDEALKLNFKDMTADKIAERIRSGAKDEEEGKNLALTSGRQYVVEVVREVAAPAPVGAGARGKPSKKPE